MTSTLRTIWTSMFATLVMAIVTTMATGSLLTSIERLREQPAPRPSGSLAPLNAPDQPWSGHETQESLDAGL